jgi:hypothetical protein
MVHASISNKKSLVIHLLSTIESSQLHVIVFGCYSDTPLFEVSSVCAQTIQIVNEQRC